MNVETVAKLTKSLTFYTPLAILLVGNVGCLLNLLTFTSKQLRRNSCGWYFLMSSVTDFILINFGLITRLSSDHFGSNYQNTSRTYCRLRIYLTWTLPSLSTAYLVLSSVDRCLSTSEKTHYRSLSQLKVAYRLTLVPIVIYGLSNAHEFYYFDLRPKCVAQPGPYSLFLSIYSIVWTSIIPQSLLFTSGLITYQNVRSSRERLAKDSATDRKKNRMDSHLIKITLIQVIGSSILLNIRTIYYSYYVLSIELPKGDLRKSWEDFVYQISNYFFYGNFCKGFYLNTLMSRLFRRVLVRRLRFCISKLSLRKVRINPGLVTDATVH